MEYYINKEFIEDTMKTIIINFVPKKELYPLLSKAIAPDLVLIREDLPRWIRRSLIMHEIHHLGDDDKGFVRREGKAIMAQLFIPLLGGVASVVRSICSIDRLKYYWGKLK